MKLADQLTDYINAAFTGIWVQTSEPDEAEREIVQHARQKKWKIAVWDVAAGVRLPGNQGASQPELALAIRWPPFGRAGAGGRQGHCRPGPAQFPPVPEQSGGRANDVRSTRRRQAAADLHCRARTNCRSCPSNWRSSSSSLNTLLPDREQLERIAVELTSDNPNDLPKGERFGPRLGRCRRTHSVRSRGCLRPVLDSAQRDPA